MDVGDETMTDTTVETGLELIEHLDFDVPVPCESPTHPCMGADGPAVWMVVTRCTGCGERRSRRALCQAWVTACVTRGTMCPTCRNIAPLSDVLVSIEPIRGRVR